MNSLHLLPLTAVSGGGGGGVRRSGEWGERGCMVSCWFGGGQSITAEV